MMKENNQSMTALKEKQNGKRKNFMRQKSLVKQASFMTPANKHKRK